jgi:hypothetical protein
MNINKNILVNNIGWTIHKPLQRELAWIEKLNQIQIFLIIKNSVIAHKSVQ